MNRNALLSAAVAQGGRCVLVSVSETQGSVPRDAGAWMIVTASGYHGSIGGGALEWKAMAEAQAMMEKDTPRRESSQLLGPELGQCCGGRVNLAFDLVTQQNLPQFTSQPIAARQILLFGAGHVGRALVLALANLPFSVRWVDGRPGAHPAYVPDNVLADQRENPVSVLNEAVPGTMALVMTHSHALDFDIVDSALRNPNIAFTGLIGSETKRARFLSRLKAGGITGDQFARFGCPIGISGISGKEPGVIAASTVAQLLVLDEKLRQGDQFERHAQLSA